MNNTLGHTIGDQLFLRDVASRLVGTVRATDTISRQGGDEFIIPAQRHRLTPKPWRTSRARSWRRSPNPSAWGHQITVTPSIGISVSPEDGDDLDSLLKHADLGDVRRSSRDATTTSSSGAK